jgi:ribonucleoside-diphosphate reductase beta chain
MTSITELNSSLGLPEQDPREVVYNSALNRKNELFPFKFPSAYPVFQYQRNPTPRRLEDLVPHDLRSYPLELYLRLYETEPNLANHHVSKAFINTKRITIATTSKEPNLLGFAVIVKRQIFFHKENPFYSLDEVTETGIVFTPAKNDYISVNTGSSEPKPWIAFYESQITQPSNNDTSAITSIGSSSSSGQNDSDFEMHELTPEENITRNNLFMNLRSGRYESLLGERALIQAFTTNCDHCAKALKDFEVFSEALTDKGTTFIALCIRGEIDEARKFVPEPPGNVRFFYAESNAANNIRRVASATDNIESVPFYMATHENGKIIHISRSRNSVVTAINHHPTASKCFVSPVPQITSQKTAENMGLLKPEPFLSPSNDRFVTYPIRHNDLWAKYKNHFASFWSPEEIDLKGDKDDFDNKLNDNERYFIKHVLAFFAASDGIVNENLALNFSAEIQVTEARYFYHFQMAMENVHAETYSLLIDTYVTEAHEKNKLLHALEHFDCIKKKADWAIQWCNSDFASFSERCVAFSAVEGIFFSGSFCAIFWIKQKGLMPGLCSSNELIARDEGLHTDFACLIYSKLENKLTHKRVAQIIRSAVEIEKEFVSTALPVSLLGMNASTMTDYIEYVADHLLVSLGNPRTYNTPNPYEWMNQISLDGKANFFEKQVTEHALSGVDNTGAPHWNDRTLDMDADF